MQRLTTLVLPALAVASLTLTAACDSSEADEEPPAVTTMTIEAPVAKKQPYELEQHGDVRIDDYHWLRERDNPEVIDYLEAENRYTAERTADIAEIQEEVFAEIKERLVDDDESVPYELNGYWYYRRLEEGREYPIYVRRKGSMDADEEIMLDVNALDEGHSFTAVRGLDVSPDNRLLVYGVDHVGRRKFDLEVRDLSSGETLPDSIPEVTGNVVWAGDSETFFYAKQDPETLRSYQIFRHRLGDDPADDPLVYQEDDPIFSTYVGRSKSREYLFIQSRHSLRTEVRFLRADQPESEPQLFQEREGELEYSVDHYGDRFYIRTNRDGENFHLMSTPVDQTGKEHWTEVVPHRENVLLQDFEIFRDHLVLVERSDALVHLRVRPWAAPDRAYTVEFDEPVYALYPTGNLAFDTTQLRFQYSSLTTPDSTFDFDMATRERKLLKQEAVEGGFDPSDYVTARLWVEARDGTNVPVSIVHRTGVERDGQNPLLLYAYGSYGSSMSAGFNLPVISLLDRGFVYAIAHVRGGQEMGHRWYEAGKMLNKKNTFTDFIDVAEGLIAEGYTSRDRLFARGGSAGGLLMGAIVNMRPDLWAGVVAGVPFVDVVTTMLDESIPLTSFEWEEWGDPRVKEEYEYMLSYSPYDNVGAHDYPNLLVTTGLHDSQVQYWEPAKWVAKLRAMKTNDNLLLLKTNMEAGHGGASGRYQRYEELAFEYAFMIGIAERAAERARVAASSAG